MDTLIDNTFALCAYYKLGALLSSVHSYLIKSSQYPREEELLLMFTFSEEETEKD
jgi:hypothetical protein